jgi:hypothetical protein
MESHDDLTSVSFIPDSMFETLESAFTTGGEPLDFDALPYYFDSLVLPPGGSITVYISTPGDWAGGNIYLRYSLMDTFEYGTEIAAIRGRHRVPLPSAVGDDVVPLPELDLSQNVPNPFNPRTSLRYAVAEAGPVTLHVCFLPATSGLFRTPN